MTQLLDSDKKLCSSLFDILLRKGIRDIVCSPGSRNAPLLLAAAARRDFKKHFAIDERSAAFIGLGISLVSRKPVALVCTSGTALLNYAPAVAEAFYQGVPLIVVSADRPQQWIDQDDSQTIRQDGILDNIVKKSYSLPAYGDDNPELQWFVNRIVNDAMMVSTSGKPGPVHINVRLSEPLGNKIPYSSGNERIINVIEADSIGNKEIIRNLANKVSESKVMLVAGFMEPDDSMQKWIGTFAKLPNVTVMAETLSNLHLESDSSAVDSVLTAFPQEKLDEISPELVISVGGSLVSRKLKEYLRRNSHKCEHWTIGFTRTTTDCFTNLSLRVETDPARFFRGMCAVLRKTRIDSGVAGYKEIWRNLRNQASAIKIKFVESAPWSELKAFDFILNSIPRSFNLFLSNGTSVRYAQIIPYSLPHASYCNRGVSGIDGSVSTAIGGSLVYKGNTIIITGDLSMAYDIGALSFNDIPENFKVIVIDNQGGGIFRFIPSTSSLPEREEYFCMNPRLPLDAIAPSYGFQYFEAHDEKSLRASFKEFLNSGKSILRIVCPGEESAEILKGYMKTHVDE